MDFDYSDRCKELRTRLLAFMDEHIYPNEKAYKQEIDRNGVAGNRWVPTELIERLKPLAREQGLWNLFLPKSKRAPEGLSNLDYAPLCEIMGRVGWAPEVFNCSAPDTGNMETLERYAAEEFKQQWLEPLLRGEIRSAFAMTEPDVASSDATNIATRIERDGDDYVINGHKWWISGAGDPRCQIYIVMGKTDPEAARHQQQSMILVPGEHPRHHGETSAAGVRLRRRAARPLRNPVRERARAGLAHAARRRPRLRDRPGPPRTGPHPPLHARHRRGRARARTDVQAPRFARRLRQEDFRTGRLARTHRRVAHPHRHRAPAHA